MHIAEDSVQAQHVRSLGGGHKPRGSQIVRQ